MTEPTNYPALSSLLNIGALPSNFGFLEGAAEQLLEGFRYSDLIIETSPANDAKYFGVTLVVKELAVDLLGSGLRLIFFPAPIDEPADVSKIPISFSYQWPILRYIPDFETLTFAHGAHAFFDLVLAIADVTEEELLEGLLDALIDDPAPYQALYAKLSSWQNGNSPLAALQVADVPLHLTEIGYLVEQAEALEVDLFTAAFEAIVEDVNDAEQALDNVLALGRQWLGGIDHEDLERLLLPEFSVELKTISMAIEAPRSVLIPLDVSGKQIEAPAASRLTFTAGGVRYDSVSGFEIDIDESLEVDFQRSVVPGFGLTLEFIDVKIDLSRTTNIAEATAEGRPVDFVGVFVGKAVVGLPEKWFAAYRPADSPPATLAVVGRNLLIGTGGISGKLGLEVVDAVGKPTSTPTPPSTGQELSFVLGKKPDDGSGEDRKGFVLGFSLFEMTFQQNHVLDSQIKGSLTIPGFNPDPIGIVLDIQANGNFEVTASIAGGKKLDAGDIFSFTVEKLSVGKDDRGVFISAAGDLSFADNAILGPFLKQPIHLDKLLVHTDGSIEIEGGKIPLPESAVLAIGPAKIAITAIGFGSHQQEHGGVLRSYRYFTFDGGVSLDPGGINASGDGITLYYTVDNSADRPLHTFMGIDGMHLDLVIPSTSSRDQAVLLLQGYLAMKKPVYQGSLQFQLPQVGIAGGASMKYDTSYPAWIVMVNLELPNPLPLGSTSLAAYGFQGLFGLRYIASKDAIDPPLADDASWGDYYRAKQPEKGVSVDKFVTPEKTKGSRNPFSIGVGVSLGTLADGGKLFSAQLLLLVSLPNLIMLVGRGDVLAKKRVGLTDDDPPYYAYLALSPESIELGVGVNYLVPKDTGRVLDLNAVLEAAFFFHNSSAWYVNFGTKAKPVKARIISLFDGYAYLMLSASGIETGAGVHFDFSKRYGPVGVSAHSYLDFWAYVSFERSQAGGGVALGGSVDVTLFKIALHIGLAAGLTVEVPKPFRVAGSVEVCISAKLLVKKITKCCTLQFVWQKSDDVDQSRVDVMVRSGPPAAVAVHMVSGSTYPVTFSGSASPPPTTEQHKPIPLDCFIDVKFAKPVNPAAVAGRIGGYTSPPVGATEVLPPRFGSRRVQHAYSLDDVKLEVLKNGHWENYHPYAALAPGALLSTDLLAELDGMPLGVWQKKDAAYSQLRFLALTPFSWMNPIGGYRPEESGVTAHSTYCVARARQPRCVVWDVPATYASGTDYLRGDVLHRVDGDRMEAVALSNPRLRPVSLAVGPAGQASFQFLEPVVSCRLSMVTTAPSVVVRWQRRKRPAALPDGKERVATVRSGSLRGQWAPPEYEDAVAPVVLAAAALANPVVYDNPAQPIERVVIETPRPDARTVARLAEAIERRTDDWIRSPKERPAIAAEIARLKEQLQAAHDKTCLPHRPVVDNTAAIERLTSDLTRLRTELDKQRVRHRTLCGPTPDPRQKRLPPEECRALAALIAKLEGDAKLIEGRIRELREASEIRFPPGWECGTFVHEVCWLSETDFAYNQTIPQIDAIEADFGTMRAAVEGSIAPIWQPEQTYRITLKVADHVKGPTVDASLADRHYVHFRTGAPLGHFADIPTAGLQPPGPTDVDDGRIEAPERALRYYFDMQRSEPDPSGNLLYAKPVYYRAVILRLLFDKPHAYHFFADWPDGGTYALELAVKDPAEAAPPRADAPAHEAAITVEPTLGEQTWAVDGGVKVAEEFKALRNFQHPQAGRDQKAVCLTSGGDPITPLGKMLETKVGDLRPNKLYTAVVLNRRIDPQAEAVAEVGRFGFMTSRYADFAGHIASFQLTDDDHNERLAVFGIDHDLPGADAAQTLAAARAIVDLVPSTETLAYPDPFDRLCYELLRLEPLPPPSSLECNFVTAPATGVTYAIWLRSLEALFDPRRPATELSGAIELLVGGTVVDTRVLLSRDRSQAFVIAGAGAGALPTEGVSFAFANLGWDGLVGAPVATPVFSRP